MYHRYSLPPSLTLPSLRASVRGPRGRLALELSLAGTPARRRPVHVCDDV